MGPNRKVAITGVAGYTGAYTATRFLDAGWDVLNLTGHPDRIPSDSRVTTALLTDEHGKLAESLRGCDVLVNSYWIRFERGEKTFKGAVKRVETLLKAAAEAGISKIVHVSIANPEAGACGMTSAKDFVMHSTGCVGLPYYTGKYQMEEMVRNSGISYSILRPTVLFGREGILINNIAWFLRHLPVFGIPGNGSYHLQPVFVEDFADLIFAQSTIQGNVVMDAVGPENFKFTEILDLLKKAVGSKAMIVNVPEQAAMIAVKAMGVMVNDVVMTDDELKGLSLDLLESHAPPTCPTKLSDWVNANSDWLGKKYFSEVKKHYT